MPAPRTTGWRPLLEGTARDAARDAIEAIAAAARPAIEDWSARHDDPSGAHAHSLAWGRSGVALFYAYRALASPHDADLETAALLLDRSIDALREADAGPSLFTGFTGVAWVTEHLATAADDARDEDEDPNADIDAALLDRLDASDADAEWDLVEGLVGWGVYARERLPRPGGRRVLERVVDRLAALSNERDGERTWPTPPWRRRGPGGWRSEHDLGVAHGVPGIIALLGLALEAGVRPARCRELMDGAVRWLLARRLPPGGLSRFPAHLGEGAAAGPARCAWCYGDPGVAVALLGAARRAGVAEWEDAAREVARHAASVRERRNDVRDAQLCHGATGVAHAFHRVHRATGDPEVAAAARWWFDRALAFRRPGDGPAGFRSWSAERTPGGEWIDDPRFLTGIAGIGLALLAATTDVEPAWDRALLMSIPPPAP